MVIQLDLQCTGVYRDEIYSLQIVLSRTQAGPGRKVKQEQEEISPNHVQRLILISVDGDEALQNSQHLFLHFELKLKYVEVIENKMLDIAAVCLVVYKADYEWP